MTSSRLRIAIMAAVLVLVALGGVFWLVSATTGGGEGQRAAGEGSSMGPNGGAPGGTNGGSGAGGTGAGGGEGRSKSGGGIQVNGVRLDGNTNDDGCFTLINKTSRVGVIEAVSFAVTEAPGRTGVRTDSARCTENGDPVCAGITLRPGGECVAGARLTGGAKPGDYTLQAIVRYRYTCTGLDDEQDDPCSRFIDWRGSPPTPEKPVEVSGTTSANVPSVFIVVGGPGPSEETSPGPPPGESPEPSPEQPEPSPEPPPEEAPGDSGSSPGSG